MFNIYTLFSEKYISLIKYCTILLTSNFVKILLGILLTSNFVKIYYSVGKFSWLLLSILYQTVLLPLSVKYFSMQEEFSKTDITVKYFLVSILLTNTAVSFSDTKHVNLT